MSTTPDNSSPAIVEATGNVQEISVDKDIYTVSLSLVSLEQMQRLAKLLSMKLRSGDIITLTGEVGTGKTTFVRALISTISQQAVDVTSPTFNIMQSYPVVLEEGTRDTIWHLDCYRLKDGNESESLGLNELWSHIVIVEWPEVIASRLPQQRLDINITMGARIDTRDLLFKGDVLWSRRLEEIV